MSWNTECLGVSSVKDLPDVKDFMADKIDNADLPLTQRTLAKDHLAGLPDGDATLHGDFHPGNVLATTDGPRVIDWGEASQGDPAADIARTLVLLTPESAAGALPHAGQATALIAAFAHTYLQRCVETTQVTVEAIAAWRLPVIAARLSEHIAETCAHNRLAAELGTVNRFVVLLGRPLATATPLASRFHI